MLEVFCPMISNFSGLKKSAQQAEKQKPYTNNPLVLKKTDVKRAKIIAKEISQENLQQDLISDHHDTGLPKVFDGLRFFFDLGSLDHVAKIEFRDLILKVTENGGIQSLFVNSNVDYVVSSGISTDTSQKLKTAKRLNIPIVLKNFVEICIQESKLLDPGPFLISNYSKAENFQHGTITLSNEVSSKTSRDVKKSHSKFNIVPEPYDPAILEDYVLLKFVQLKGKTVTQTISDKAVINYQFYILELHATITENYEKPSTYCVFSHEGEIKDLDNKNKSKKLCRFVTTASEAVNLYGQLVKQMTGAPKYFTYTQEYLSDKLGSPKFQEIQTEMHLNIKNVDPKIINIVYSLWEETLQDLKKDFNDPLNVPSWKIKEGIKILHQINFVLKNSKEKAIISRLSQEFYNVLSYDQGEDLKLSDLAKKYAMCAKLNDLVQLIESSPLNIKKDPEARFRALRCNLNYVKEDTQEYNDIARLILDSQNEDTDIKIQNIFNLSRNSEAILFRADLGNKKLLFHGTSPDNLMGVVSRSLQTPNEFASSLKDNLLGLGIYFTDSSSFAAKYCSLVKASGTRFMLICEVALGKTYTTNEAESSLTSAPSGYDSVLGAKSDGQRQSCFSENEYAIYDNRQCKLNYLVEYSFQEDPVPSIPKTITSSIPKTTIQDISKYEYNIIPSEKSNNEDLAGLECVDKNNNHALSLKNIHVRTQIVDLVAKVYLFQTYFNESDKLLEVQYVFPLDSGAAICGFEAFIGDKHIVGEVKEKETARKEYETAKKEGHGAYLLEESSRNVFTVHVGNIPPHTTAVLKITYIGELIVENDSVVLNVPSLFPNKDNKPIRLPDFTFQASIEMATEILSISSPTHRVIRKKTDTKAVIKIVPQIEKQSGPATNIPDIILMIRIANIHVPRMWIEKHPKKDTRACMVTFYPEFQTEGLTQSNPTIFLLDASDAMNNTDFQALINLILLSLDQMKFNTLFNIVAFGTIQRELFPLAQPFTMETHSKAKDFIADLRPNMGKALIAQTLRSCSLLSQNNATDFFLITNGIGLRGNSLFNLNLKDTRIFSFGIGKQNQHLLQLISRRTGGSYASFHSSEKTKWSLKVKNLLQKSTQPSLRDIDVEWQNEDNILQAPKKLFSIFNGFSQIIYALDTFCTVATLTARIGQQEVSTVVSTHELSQTTGSMIHSLAARAYIQDWEDGILDDDEILNLVAKDDAKSSVIDFAKENSLVTSLTSFVAVEKRSDEHEVFAEISVEKLLKEVDIDILNYMVFIDDSNMDTEHDDGETVSPVHEKLSPIISIKPIIKKKMVEKKRKRRVPKSNDREIEDEIYSPEVLIPCSLTEDCLTENSVPIKSSDIISKKRAGPISPETEPSKFLHRGYLASLLNDYETFDCYVGDSTTEVAAIDISDDEHLHSNFGTLPFYKPQSLSSDSRSPKYVSGSPSYAPAPTPLNAALPEQMIDNSDDEHYFTIIPQCVPQSSGSDSRSPRYIPGSPLKAALPEPMRVGFSLNSVNTNTVQQQPQTMAFREDFSSDLNLSSSSSEDTNDDEHIVLNSATRPSHIPESQGSAKGLPGSDSGSGNYIAMAPSYTPALQLRKLKSVAPEEPLASSEPMRVKFCSNSSNSNTIQQQSQSMVFGAVPDSYLSPFLGETNDRANNPTFKIANQQQNQFSFGSGGSLTKSSGFGYSNPTPQAPPPGSSGFGFSAMIRQPPPQPLGSSGFGFSAMIRQPPPQPLGSSGFGFSAMIRQPPPQPLGSSGFGFSAMIRQPPPQPLGSSGFGFSTLIRQGVPCEISSCSPTFGSTSSGSTSLYQEARTVLKFASKARKSLYAAPTNSSEDVIVLQSKLVSGSPRELECSNKKSAASSIKLLSDNFITPFKKIKKSSACKNLEDQSNVPINQILKELMAASKKSKIQFNKAISFFQENLKIRGGSLPILSRIIQSLPKEFSFDDMDDEVIPYQRLKNQNCTTPDCFCKCILLMEEELISNGLNSLGSVISGEILRMVRDVAILQILLVIFIVELDSDVLIDLEGSFDFTIKSIEKIARDSEGDLFEYFVSLSAPFVKGFDKQYPLTYASLTRCKSWEEFVFNNLKNYLLNLNE